MKITVDARFTEGRTLDFGPLYNIMDAYPDHTWALYIMDGAGDHGIKTLNRGEHIEWVYFPYIINKQKLQELHAKYLHFYEILLVADSDFDKITPIYSMDNLHRHGELALWLVDDGYWWQIISEEEPVLNNFKKCFGTEGMEVEE